MTHKHPARGWACVLCFWPLFLLSCVNNPGPMVLPRNQGSTLVLTGVQEAEAGGAQAQFEQAMTYAMGRGPERNLIMAYKWATLAAVQGHPLAKELRDKLRKDMTPVEVAMAEQMAAEFRPQLK